ncbi:hypothetical protein J4214_02530 [Candidatus Woesearchaeota archaeon]|nr:hypothetical protein [Candidatus Woesearchaeota archaeon]
MNIACPECKEECNFEINQRMINENCDVKIKFNIVEIECKCGNKGLISIAPKEITVINSNMKVINF